MAAAGVNYQFKLTSLKELPEMELESTMGEIKIPNDILGQISILVFYPADGSAVCTNQMAVYNQAISIFRSKGAELYGISVDNMISHKAFANKMNLKFPLIADDKPKGGIAKLFGYYNDQKDTTDRAIAVFDEDGGLYWQQVYPDHVNPGAEGIMKALDELDEREEEDEEDQV